MRDGMNGESRDCVIRVQIVCCQCADDEEEADVSEEADADPNCSSTRLIRLRQLGESVSRRPGEKSTSRRQHRRRSSRRRSVGVCQCRLLLLKILA